MMKFASITACALVFAASISVGPVAAATSGDREIVVGSQTTIDRDGCGWNRHYSWRRGRCVWNW